MKAYEADNENLCEQRLEHASVGRSQKALHLRGRAIRFYIGWRAASADVRHAYARWSGSPRDEEDANYGAYVSALDREERAANRYRRFLVLVESSCTPSASLGES